MITLSNKMMIRFPRCSKNFCGYMRILPCSTSFSSRKSLSSSTSSLSKLLSKSTDYSRRELERIISNGEVTVKGKVVEQPRLSVDDWKDIRKGGVVIKVKGKPVVIKEDTHNAVPRVWAVHKFPGEIVAEKDPQGRKSMIDRLKQGGVGRKHRDHLKPIGRLDIPTEGLILVTNDGGFKREMELPKNQVHRVYKARGTVY